MRLFERAEGWRPAIPYGRPAQPERLLLRVGGLNAFVRPIRGRGATEPWEEIPHVRRLELSLDALEKRLDRLSGRITEMLRQWWGDPPGLTYRIRMTGNNESKHGQHATNSYIVVSEILSKNGVPYSGSGLKWFLGFVIELLFLETETYPILLLFDEPGSALHPAAQRSIAKLISSLSRRHQVIYSTHSPFMIDWNFPQRIRLFSRDHDTGRTSIENKPYAGRGAARRIWDPLRETLGISLGDITVVGELNVLVEGITDQVLFANASAKLQALGRPHFDLERISIVPFGDEDALGQLLHTAERLGGRSVVLVDSDNAGRTIARKLGAATPCREIGEFVGKLGRDYSIEDIIGVDAYVEAVNDAYSEFAWFSPLEPGRIREDIGQLSLGTYVENAFKARFDHDFSKTFLAVTLAASTAALDGEVLERFSRLIAALADGLSGQAPPSRPKLAVNRELAALKRSLTLALQGRKILTRSYVPMLRESNPRQGFFERLQFEAVERHLPEAIRPVAHFAYLTGWRLSEVVGLTWRQVDFGAATVRLEPGTTKNRAGGMFPFTPELRALLEAQRAITSAVQTKTGRIVPEVFHRDGAPIRSFRRAWLSACLAAGVPGRIFHDFRRTAVRNLERAGVPRSVAMQMVGHKTEAIYRRYAIVSDADLRAAADKLAAIEKLAESGTGTITGTVARIGAR